MTYKIVASDLDGTLLDSKGNLSCENLSAIREIARLGVVFVPASGRSLMEIPKILRDDDSIRFYIHSSGAGLYDKKTGENVSFGFPYALSKEVFNLVFSEDCYVSVRRDGRIFADSQKMNDESMTAYNLWGPHVHLLRTCGEGICNFEEVMLASSDIDLISLFFRDEKALASMREKLSQIAGINVASACAFNIEVTYEKAGKGNALISLAEKLSVETGDIIAIGDSENDLPMISTAGLGLATGNAAPLVKEQADSVICSNDENIVSFVFAKYF